MGVFWAIEDCVGEVAGMLGALGEWVQGWVRGRDGVEAEYARKVTTGVCRGRGSGTGSGTPGLGWTRLWARCLAGGRTRSGRS